jgi:hypothetical protein
MKSSTVTLIEVDYHELDETVTKFLKEKQIKWHSDEQYQCVAEQEWGNDQSHCFTVDGDVDEDCIQRIKDGRLGWSLGNILNWMASEGALAKGEYKIDVCW